MVVLEHTILLASTHLVTGRMGHTSHLPILCLLVMFLSKEVLDAFPAALVLRVRSCLLPILVSHLSGTLRLRPHLSLLSIHHGCW